MTVYALVKRTMDQQISASKGFADQYLSRLMEGHAEAEVSARLSKEAFDNAAALGIVLSDMPVELAEREI